MHFSAHGRTAAELIYERVDADKPFLGLTSWTGLKPKKADVVSAKNYLTADELDTLNRIVNMYLEFAELQAKQRKPMYMADWIVKLDDFMKLSDREILTHTGKISHEIAKQKPTKNSTSIRRGLRMNCRRWNSIFWRASTKWQKFCQKRNKNDFEQ